MKRWLDILIVVCVLLTALKINAEDRPALSNNPYKMIQVFKKHGINVHIQGDAEKMGLNEDRLTDYCRLEVKNNFSNIKFENFSTTYEKYTSAQIGLIKIRAWLVGNSDYPVTFHLRFKFIDGGLHTIYEDERLGHGYKDALPDMIKNSIGEMVENFSILFYKVRGETQ